jgi:signal transduction histidine kinase
MKQSRVDVVRVPSGERHELPDPARASTERLERNVQAVAQSPMVTAILEVSDSMLMVLNPERQIVAFNSRVAGVRSLEQLVGRRMGDVLGCADATGAGGCGTGAACATCGALGAVLACQSRALPVESECLIRTDLAEGGALELNVRASPIDIEGTRFTVVSLRDISSEKRREVLEQVFFHDVLNTVAGLRGWAQRLQLGPVDLSRVGERIDYLTQEIEREIGDHRAVLQAEKGALVPARECFRTGELLRGVAAVFASHPAARDRRLELGPPFEDAELVSDRSLVLRVLVNMVRNAFEATGSGHVVRLGCRALSGGVRLSVHNDETIPRDVQARIFQRSFSTKASHGRGLGTYSMKLFGERYLGGKVSFTSTPESGTEFAMVLPTA